jgi:hypothetical protein
VHVGVLSTNSNSPGRILRPNRLRCVNCLALPIIIISMETIKDLYAVRRPRLSPTAPSPGAIRPVYGTSFETTRARRMLRRFSAAVATNRPPKVISPVDRGSGARVRRRELFDLNSKEFKHAERWCTSGSMAPDGLAQPRVGAPARGDRAGERPRP